ncbi:hypothetical protein H4R33_002392 [Dimargaris cristalligena]|uniref:7-dehydrocholesterol reductase n=1 Tax=Dimargaris cristalligena TaxID=215637 RepID=A0A4Q0A180_9FUNG|nr:hypothetical protein H4R33_002392 [Dimargaris cristalligena]RKP39211.1 7-dehydrosterol-delta 7-reductase [Dimargaris cristalligena]|eukprot:RKP39211.1 7-dehydrosterol-delta 7-reductase [Dimargaris cristalligena]
MPVVLPDASTLPLRAQTGKTWGRSRDVSRRVVLSTLTLLLLCPLMVIYFWLACTHYQCSLVAPYTRLSTLFHAADPLFGPILRSQLPQPSVEAALLFAGWLVFQGLLYAFLPGPVGQGQQTPAGHILPYKVNGLRAWLLTHALFVAGSSLGLGWFSASIIYDHWGGLLIAANLYGYGLTAFAFSKAHLFPTHAEDRKFSGSYAYDLFMGIELNPRFGQLWDFKLFHNGRPGIIGWTLINLSFAAAQYQQLGRVTNSMVLLNFLHAVYVVDFFYHEDWYLRTIDIAHDHFGFYLAWGDSVWLPFMYTLQSHFLVRHPIDLPWLVATGLLAMGLVGYYIFRHANNQKDLTRKADGKLNIWGRPAQVIRAAYSTSDGKQHTSILLTSGFWGISRHFNYVGDLLMCFAFCAACGFDYLLPHFYFIYMTILLVHRIQRDGARCTAKYGPYWDEYCRRVPYKLIPYIY